MQVTVNRDLCQGHGRCVVYAPTVFELDESGYSCARQAVIPAESEPAALDAQRACPEEAITVEMSQRGDGM